MNAAPPPIPHPQAQQLLLGMAQMLGSEKVATASATGRHLAAPLAARRTQPPTDLSAMDGYAVRTDDRAGPWRVIGESAAGHPFARAINRGEAIRISTGASLPPGAGAILLQEDALRKGDGLRPGAPDAATPQHIRRRGLDFHEGEQLLGAGDLLNPARIALAISAGHGMIEVGRRPSLAVLETGDELASDPQAMGAHQIPASNGAMIAALAAPLASQVVRIGPVADSLGALASALAQCHEVDVLVTSGGASVGDHDLIRPALAEWGADTAFWRIAMKPGKPLLVARRGHQFVLGLPGNPVSSYATTFLFVLPLLRRLAGAADPLPRPLALPLARALPAGGVRAEFVRAVIGPDGASPVNEQDSSALAALAAADCLIERPALAPAAQAGEIARVYPLW